MTVENTQVRQPYQGDGTTRSFPVPWPFFLGTDLTVYLDSNIQTSGYSVTGGSGSTGSVVFASAPSASQVVTILLDVPLTQLTNFVDGTAFPSATIDEVNDRAIQAILRLSDRFRATVRGPDYETNALEELPPVAQRASQFLAFDASGNPVVSSGTGGGDTSLRSDLGNTTTAGKGSDLIAYRLTASENAASIVSYAYTPGDSRRYATLQDAHDALPSTGGVIDLPEGTISFDGLIINKPVILRGRGAAIFSGNTSSTVLSYTGSGIAIDVHDGGSGYGGRGSVLKDFQLVNSGTGTIGIRLNNQDPKLENVYVYQTVSGYAGFSVAAIRAGDANEVNDLLMRDCYIRQQPALAIDLWQVSEGTLDHVRLIQNRGYQIKIGDAASGSTCNGLNLVNGTSPQVANISGSGGILIERSAFKLLINGAQFESDSVNGAHYAIDARTATVCDSIIVKNSYFTGSSWGGTAAYAISAGLAGANVEVDGCYFVNFSTSAVNNVSASSISFGPGNTLNGCPALVDAFSAAVQQYTGAFTPTVLGSSIAGTTTYTAQNGTFSRDGHRVSFRIRVSWSGQTGTGNLLVGNLPLSSANTDNHPAMVIADSLTFSNQLVAYVVPNSTLISVAQMSTGTALAAVPIDTAASLWISGTYFV